jgi:serine/threonine-protein kinase
VLPAPGRWVGRYRLIERLGSGRQADVWRAVRCEPTEGEVALKVLPLAASGHDPRRLAQLRREAERGSRLADPALLPTYDFGEVDGLVYLAMPLVVGCTLGAILDQRRERLALAGGLRHEDGPPTDETVRRHRLADAPEPAYVRAVVGLLARVGRAVAAAHAARVAHRDIKPTNILVAHDLDPSGSGPGVYLCDFGLARDLDVATPVQLRDGAGSPLYMAPERLLKRPADEFRGDVYALGVTLFESLTLEAPVEVPPDLPRSLWSQFLADTAPRRLRELRPDLPAALEAVTRRAMARDPSQRHPTAARFAVDLERFLGRCDSPAWG